MKKFLKEYLLILLMIIMLILLTGCGISKQQDNLNSKVNSEISYLDGEIVSITNQLNNINYEKYKVNVEEIKNVSQNSGESKESKSSESEGGAEKQSGGEKSSDSNGKDGEEEKSSQKYSMKSNNILGQQEQIDWDNLKNKIENLYTTWTAISLDLKEMGIPSEQLNSFGSQLDFVAISIKNEDKNSTIDNLIKLYEFLPNFADYIDGTKEKDVLICKYNLLLCYKYANLEDKEQLKSSIIDLKMSFSNVSNKKDQFKGKEYNIESGNVIIEEMKNVADSANDKEVFFIKYKNLMQELNIILSI